MPKIVLHDDAPPTVCDPNPAPDRVRQHLYPEATVDENIFGVMEIYMRIHTNVDTNGDRVYSWVKVLEGRAIAYEQRRQLDSLAGQTFVTAEATICYDGEAHIDETANVHYDGSVWRVTAIYNPPGYLVINMRKIHAPQS